MEAYHQSLRIHDSLAGNRSRFGIRLLEMSEELMNLAKEGERLRKTVSSVLWSNETFGGRGG